MIGSPELLEEDELGNECIFRYRTPPAPEGLNASTGRGYRVSILQADCETSGDNSIVFTDSFNSTVPGEETLSLSLDVTPSIPTSVFYDQSEAAVTFCLNVAWTLNGVDVTFHNTHAQLHVNPLDSTISDIELLKYK